MIFSKPGLLAGGYVFFLTFDCGLRLLIKQAFWEEPIVNL
jgi:hypothetical protein